MTSASIVERPSAASAAARPAAAQRLHHLAYVTHDTEATVDFYTRIMGMPLVNAVVDDHVPSTKAPYAYFHSFFRLGSGETIAFFECPGIPKAPPKAHPAYDDFEHLALEVPSRAEVERWRAWLEQNGVEVISNDHGIIYSIYFRDRINNIRLEITATIAPDWNDRETAARASLALWTRTKQDAETAGEDVVAALRKMAGAQSHSARRGKD